MNKKTKGFTLIELLAIIVILAIIAVITVPIILNVIDNAKQGAAKDSAYGYKDAISKYYVTGMLEEDSINLNGTYNVVDGKLGKHDIPFSGTKPTSGYLGYIDNVLIDGCLTIDGYKVTFENGEVKSSEVGECGEKVYKCKRATELHTEECNRTTYGCFSAGYYTEGSKGTSTITYGNTTVTQGKLISGDAYDCDVDGDGEYEETERFYYVSDLYNTNEKNFNNKYAVMIYYNNTVKDQPNNTSLSLIAYNEEGVNYNGPLTGMTYLPTITEWNNINLANKSRTIINEKGERTTNNGANTLPTEYRYEGCSSRLLTAQEVNNACNITLGHPSEGELDNCNYLLENTIYGSNNGETFGYWLETAYSGSSSSIWNISGLGRYGDAYSASYNSRFGVRPAIEVLKTDIEI